MSREDDEFTVDDLLRHASPDPAPASGESAHPTEPSSASGSASLSGLGFAGHVAQVESGSTPYPSGLSDLRVLSAPLEPSQPAAATPNAGDTPAIAAESEERHELDVTCDSAASDLESQRLARVERLRAAEDKDDIGSAIYATEVKVEQESDTKSRAMADGDRLLGEGLRLRRRPEEGGAEGTASSTAHDVKPPDTFTPTPTSAPESKPAVATDEKDADGVKKEEAGSEPRSGAQTPGVDEKQCRICFGGWEDEPDLGRLISPCLCAGSMRYVHVKCINQWRGTGVNAKSFMECPQCHHQYSIRRTAVSGLATSKPILYLFTTILFLQITFVCGHVLLRYLVAAADVAAEADRASKAAEKDTTTVGGMTRHGDVWESEDGSVIIAAPGLTLVYDIVVEAVDIFLDLAATAYDMWPRNGRGFKSRASRLALSGTIRLILGLSVLGSLSFLSLLASLSLFAPLQLVYTLFGTGLFRGPLENLRRRAPNAGGIIVIAAVVIGIANSVVGVYDLVTAVARKLLAYVETQILEVNPEEARLAREAAAQQPHWFDTWIAERRWRRLAGWYEVSVRLWEWIKEVYRVGVARVKASVEARVHAAERHAEDRARVGVQLEEPVRVG